MTVSVLRNKAQYTGNGSSTQFEITFAYTETSQIKVYLDGSLQTLTTHYTITDPGQTGTVTFVTAPESGVVISLIRETDYLQTVDYANNDILDAETLESAFDKLTMMCQQLKSLIDGSVGFSETVSASETTSLKLAAGITDLAGKLLAFDATGNFVTTQEIGTWQGDYSASTAYVVRDIVKDPSTDNVYFTKRNAPAGTSLSNTTYFALLVDVETVRTLKEAAELAENNAETAQAAAEAALASFQGQYKVGATNPYSGTPDAGDLWYDTTNSILKYYVSGTGFEPVTTSLGTVTDNYLTISNQVITAGTVPISLGGTGATTASGARTALGLAIGTDVQAYDADTAKYDDTTANFTGTLQNGGSNVLVDSDIGSTVQGYDANTAKLDATTSNFTGTLQNGGSNVVVDSDIGSTVQAYDADLSTIAGLSSADGNFIVGSATGWTVESGATARTSLGLGTLATQSTITESQISDLGSYITASSTDTLTNKSGAISQWTNDSGYLTAETNDLSAVTGTLAIGNGGTGQTTAAAARIALLPTLGTAGQVLAVNTGTTDVEWVDAASGGGSGTVTSVAVSGSDGIEVDSGSPITNSGTIALGINASTLSSHLSLGTAATTASTDYATAAQGSLADSAVQPGDNANTLGSGAATDGYVLTADGVGGAAWEAVSGGGGTDVTLAGSLDYLTISGQEITRNAIDLTTDVTGTLPVSNGGTGLTAGVSNKDVLAWNSTTSAWESTKDLDFGIFNFATIYSNSFRIEDNISPPTNEKYSGFRSVSGNIRFETLYDDKSSADTIFEVTRTGTTVDTFDFKVTPSVNGADLLSGTVAVANGGTGVTALSSLDAADLGSSTATDGYVLTADGSGGAAWEAASGGGGGTTAYLEHSDTISDSFTVSSGTNRMYIGGTTFSGTISVAGRLVIVGGEANFTGTINTTGVLAILGVP